MTANAITHTNSAGSALNLNDGTVYILSDIRGIYDEPTEAVLTTIPRKSPAGIYQAQNRLVRNIEVDVIVCGSSHSDLITNLRALRAHCAVDNRDEGLGTLDYTAPNGVRRAIAIGNDKMEGDAQGWLVPGPIGRAIASVTLKFVAPDPTFYDPTPVSAPGAFSGTGDVTIAVANAGDCDAWLNITYTGVVHQPLVTDAYGNYLLLEADTAAGADVVGLFLDPQNIYIMYYPAAGGSTNWYGKRSQGSSLVVAKYGTNNLTFSGDDAGDNAAIAITIYSRYSTHG